MNRDRLLSPLRAVAGASVLAVALAGCASLPQSTAPPAQAPVATVLPAPPAALVETAPVRAEGDEIVFGRRPAPEALDPELPPSEIYAGTGRFVNERAAAPPRRPAAPDGEYTFNFEGAPLPEVIKTILGDLLQENYVIAPGVGGSVTFATSRPVRAEQAMSILEMLLSWNNAALVWTDGRYEVVPMDRAIPGNLVPRMGPTAGARGFELRAVPLRYISPSEMQKILTPYARPGAIVNVDNVRRLIVLGGTARELDNYLQTIEIFDVDWLAGMSVGIFRLQRVGVETILPELEGLFAAGEETPLAGMFRFMPIDRLNSIMVITTNERYLTEIERWIERLDRGGAESGQRLFVYDVKNVKALDLADHLNQVFTGQARRSPGAGTGRTAPGQQAVEIVSTRDLARPRREPGEAVAPAEGMALFDAEDVRIIGVEENNQLIISATPMQYEAILSAIRRLDTVPLQVHIETQILEVTLNRDLQFGVRWFLETREQRNGEPRFEGVFGSTAPGANFALTVNGSELRALINALQAHGRTRVLSAPSLMVLNNRQANINVGDKVPIRTTFFNPGIGGIGQQSTVQYLDTGIILSVTPRINPGGLVFMEISQEVSVAGETPPDGNPPVATRSIESEIAVQSGETILLGGLIQRTDTQSRAGVPGLHRIPVLGRMFGSSSDLVRGTELLLLITPTVVSDMSGARELTEEYRSRFSRLPPLRSISVDDEVDARGNRPLSDSP